MSAKFLCRRIGAGRDCGALERLQEYLEGFLSSSKPLREEELKHLSDMLYAGQCAVQKKRREFLQRKVECLHKMEVSEKKLANVLGVRRIRK